MSQLEYYLSIESDLKRCANYVAFTTDNFSTYSVEFAKIIMASSAEIDTIAKELCKLIDPTVNAKNIIQYADCIKKEYPNLARIKVVMPRYGIRIAPWDSWYNGQSPKWWQSYNSIKHDRVNNFKEASLKNAIDALAGLLSINLYYCLKKKGRLLDIPLVNGPTLLAIEDISSNDDWVKGGIFWSYSLP